MMAVLQHGPTFKGDGNKCSMLNNVKKEAKQIMEEAVTRKFIHEDSSSVTSLCGAVETCVRHRLKRQVLGLFRTRDSTSSILHKVAKCFEPAKEISRLTKEAESSADGAFKAVSSSNAVDDNRNNNKGQVSRYCNQRHIWIRIALFQKVLARIIDYLVKNSSNYYEKDALISDPCDGPLLASLLEGPCALEFTKMKTVDHLWSDPHADELVLRHRIQGGGSGSIGGCGGVGGGSSASCSTGYPSTNAAAGGAPHRRLTLSSKTSKSSSSSDESAAAAAALRTPPSAKDYVESLHQNGKATLLYGKNNVLVQPVHDGELMPGYLALHQSAEGVTLSWTPNQLMRSNSETSNDCNDTDEDADRSVFGVRALADSPKLPSYQRYLKPKNLLYWDYAMKVNMEDVVYLHCHQQQHDSGTLIMVGQDGVQRPPLHFPRGGSGGSHLLAFLTCLEAGLQPHGQLDPPLWSQRDKGKVFPKVKRKWSHAPGLTNGSRALSLLGVTENVGKPDADEDGSGEIDYVFRIVATFKPQTLDREMLMDVRADSGLFSWDGLRMPKLSLPWSSTGTTGAELERPSLSSSRAGSSAAAQASGPMQVGGADQPATGPEADQQCIKASASSGKLLEGVSLPESDASAATSVAAVNASLVANADRDSIKQLCNAMKKQIISRAFFGWLAHCRHLKTVRTHLAGLVHGRLVYPVPDGSDKDKQLTTEYWHSLSPEEMVQQSLNIYTKIYYGGISHEIRKEVWPYLLGHHKFGWGEQERQAADNKARADFELTMSCWLAVESIIRLREQDKHDMKATALGGNGDGVGSMDSTDSLAVVHGLCRKVSSLSNEVFLECDTDNRCGDGFIQADAENCSNDGGSTGEIRPKRTLRKSEQLQSTEELDEDEAGHDGQDAQTSTVIASAGPVPAGEEVYTVKFLDDVALNLHRIDKDVHRCDRNYWYFTLDNLKKLRNIICTYVWQNLNVGYVQGMCDLVAPLLVVLDDESLAYSCFCALMKRMADNFPLGTAMDRHLASMRSLAQVLDPELLEHMQHNGDFTHFYFSYRWLLLDLKRELVYDDVFLTWETIWAAKHVCSGDFVLFIALALVECYRDIILDNVMDFTDVIKFFNEMAEKHSAKRILRIARELVYRLQVLVENKSE